MIKKTLTISILLLLGQTVSQVVVLPVHAKDMVLKCQDDQGKWHYGNNLKNVCNNKSSIQPIKERVKTSTPVKRDKSQ